MTKEYDGLVKLSSDVKAQQKELTNELLEIAKRIAKVDALKELTDRMDINDTAHDIFRLATVMTDEIRKGA